MGVGELMERVIGSIRTVPRSTWGVGAAVVAVVGAVQLALVALVPDLDLGLLLGGGTDLEGFAQSQDEVNLLAGQALTSVLTGVLSVLATTIVVGWTGRALALADQGARASARLTAASLRPRLGGLVVLMLATVALLAAAAAAPVALAVAGAAVGQGAAAVGGGVVGLALGVAALVRWAPVVVVALPAHACAATDGPGRSLRRSAALVAGERWRLVGIWLLSVIVLAIAGGVISSPFSAIGSLIGPDALTTWAVLGSVVASVVTVPLGALVLSLVHAELAQRRG